MQSRRQGARILSDGAYVCAGQSMLKSNASQIEKHLSVCHFSVSVDYQGLDRSKMS